MRSTSLRLCSITASLICSTTPWTSSTWSSPGSSPWRWSSNSLPSNPEWVSFLLPVLPPHLPMCGTWTSCFPLCQFEASPFVLCPLSLLLWPSLCPHRHPPLLPTVTSLPLSCPASSLPPPCLPPQGYVGDAWNVFDALVVIGSVVDIVLSQVERRQYEQLSHPSLLSSFMSLLLPFLPVCFEFWFLVFGWGTFCSSGKVCSVCFRLSTIDQNAGEKSVSLKSEKLEIIVNSCHNLMTSW